MPVVRPEDPTRDFSLDHYREIVRRIRETHMTFSFRDARRLGRAILEVERFVIMRHDVELSIPAALRLAEVDHDEGVQSTFFLLQTGDYNPFEEEDALRIRRILDLGHDIGLHYDAALFERMGANAQGVAASQIALFEAFFGTEVHAMSSHMPMRSGKAFAIESVVDTYDPLYVADIKYLSDSTQSWREGVVTDLLREYPHIHLLTHEYIWHPDNLDWDTLLLIEAQEKFQSNWRKAIENIGRFREGLRMRNEKDAAFRRRYMQGGAQHGNDKEMT